MRHHTLERSTHTIIKISVQAEDFSVYLAPERNYNYIGSIISHIIQGKHVSVGNVNGDCLTSVKMKEMASAPG